MISSVIIEVVGVCNLRCPSCPNGNSLEVAHCNSLMDTERFARILDKVKTDVPHVHAIYLYNWGEPFLHPELARLVELVKQRGWKCAISSNTNAWRNVEDVLRAKPDTLVVTLSGHEQETYGVTHAGGNVEVVVANMRKLREALDRLRSKTRVAARYLTYTHNVADDFDRVEALCKELKFDFEPGWAYLSPVQVLLKHYRGEVISEAAQRALDLLAVKPEEARSLIPGGRSVDCCLRESQLVINSDGSVHLCCGAWGNEAVVAQDYLDTSLEEIQKSRLSHDLCKECMAAAIPDFFSYAHPDELDKIAADRLNTLGKPVRRLHAQRSGALARLRKALRSVIQRSKR